MRLLFLLLLAPVAWAGNACSSIATGNWNSAGTWTTCGATFPGNGDTYTINASHTVTIPTGVTVTVGTSPAGCVNGASCTFIGTNQGTLIINGTMIARGSLTQGSASFTANPVSFGPDSVFEFDASLATSPASQTYAWIADSFSAGSRMFTCSGTSGHAVTIRSNAGGGNGYFRANSGSADSMNWNCSYANFTRIGNANDPAIQIAPGSAAINHTFSHVTFDVTGGVKTVSAFAAAGGFSFDHCTWRNSIGVANADGSGNRGVTLLSSTATTPTGQRIFTNNVADLVAVFAPNHATIDDNIFYSAYKPTYGSWSASATPWTSFQRNLMRLPNANYQETKLSGPSMSEAYVLHDGSHTAVATGTVGSSTTSTNSWTLTASGTPGWTVNAYSSNSGSCGGAACEYDLHIESGSAAGEVHSVVSNTANTLTLLYPLRGTLSAGDSFSIYQSQYNMHWSAPDTNLTAFSYTNNVFENTGTDSNGDYMFGKVSGLTVTMTGNLAIPNAALDNPGTITSLSGATGATYTGSHNTGYAGAQSCMAVGEGGVGAAGLITSFRNNICWNVATSVIPQWSTTNSTIAASGIGPYLMTNAGQGASASTGEVTLSDHNNGFNLKTPRASTAGTFYDILNPGSGSFGTGDVSGDPNFVDTARNLWKWGLSLGLTGSRMSVIDQTLTQMLKLNDADFDSRFALAALKSYVRGGFTPRNTALHNAASDGTDIGAVALPALTVAPTTLAYTCTSGGSVPGSRAVAISASGSGVTLDNWSASKTQTWLTLSLTTGVATGSTSATVDCSGLAAGNYSDTITVASTTTGLVGSPQTVAVSVTAIAGPAISTTSLPNGTAAVAYSQTVSAVGGVLPYVWSITSGALCAGLSLNSSTGAITGTPLIPSMCSITVRVADTNLATGTQALTITVSDVARSTLSGAVSLRSVSIR